MGAYEVEMGPSTIPNAVSDLFAIDQTYNTVLLSWSTPSFQNGLGQELPVEEFDVRFSTELITEGNWNTATQCVNEPSPDYVGQTMEYFCNGLNVNTNYYFAIKSTNDFGEFSDISNIAEAITNPYPILVSSQYPMFKNNIEHTGKSSYFGVSSNDIKWFYDSGIPIDSSPIIGPDGSICIITEDGLTSLNIGGSINWQSFVTSSLSTPAMAINNTVYVGTSDGSFNAFYTDGNLKWSLDIGGVIDSSPTIGLEGEIYFGSSNDSLYCINADGSYRWVLGLDGDIISSPALSNDGITYIGTIDSDTGKLYAINPDGSESWSTTLQGGIISSPCINEETGKILIGSCSGKLYSMNSNGTINWFYSTADSIKSSPSIDMNENIIFGSNDDYVYCLDSSGDLVWSFETGDNVESSPAIDADNKVYFGSNDALFYCLNGNNGDEIWSAFTGDKITSSPAIGANSCVYVGSHDGRLYCFGPDAPVIVISPNGEEVFNAGSNQNIYWSTTGSVDHVEIYLSLDSGANYSLISDNEIDDGIYSWEIPNTLSSNCRIKIIAFDTGGNYTEDESDEDFSISSTSNDNEIVPILVNSLSKNYPNPFNPTTTISYSLKYNSNVSIDVYNIKGQRIKTLINEYKVSGSYSISWSGNDDSGKSVSSGLYFYKMQVNDKPVSIRKCLLLK